MVCIDQNQGNGNGHTHPHAQPPLVPTTQSQQETCQASPPTGAGDYGGGNDECGPALAAGEPAAALVGTVGLMSMEAVGEPDPEYVAGLAYEGESEDARVARAASLAAWAAARQAEQAASRQAARAAECQRHVPPVGPNPSPAATPYVAPVGTTASPTAPPCVPPPGPSPNTNANANRKKPEERRLAENMSREAVEFVLVHAIRRPAVFDHAKDRLQPAHFNQAGSEAALSLLWEATLALYDRYNQLPPRELLGTRALELLHSRQQLDPEAEATLLDLLRWMWEDFPGEDSFADGAAIDLLRALLKERIVGGAIRETLLGAYGRLPEDLSGFLDETKQQLADVEAIGTDGDDGMRSFRRLCEQAAAGELAQRDLIQGWIPQLKPSMIAAPSGIGKSLLGSAIGFALATDTPLFGFHDFAPPTPQAGESRGMAIGLFAVETGDSDVQRNWALMLQRAKQLEPERAAELDELALENLFLHDEYLPDIGDPASVREFARRIRNRRLKWVAIDPVFAAMGGLASEVKNSGAVYPKLQYLQQHVADAGATLTLIHHTVAERAIRQKYEDAPDHERASFPVFFQFCRTSIALKYGALYDSERGINTLLMGVHRKGRPGSGIYRVTINHGPTYTQWQVGIQRWQQVIREQRETRESRAAQRELALDHAVVTAIIEAEDNGLSANEIWNTGPTKVPGVGQMTVGTILHRLVAMQRIQERNGRYYRTNWRPPESTHSTEGTEGA